MRFVMLIRATEDSERGVLPSAELIEGVVRLNEQMARAGVLLASEGLKPSAEGVRVRTTGGVKSVVDGPFAETKELIAGFWLIQVQSKEDAIEWARRCPMPEGGEIELRRVYESADFLDDTCPPEEAGKERAMRRALEQQDARR